MRFAFIAIALAIALAACEGYMPAASGGCCYYIHTYGSGGHYHHYR